MSVIKSTTVVGAEDSMLAREQFIALIGEAMNLWLAEHPQKHECPVVVVSGSALIEVGYDEPYSGREHPNAIDLAFFSESNLPDGVLLWYSGAKRTAVEEALRMAPYGSAHIAVKFAQFDWKFVALSEPRSYVTCDEYSGKFEAYLTSRYLFEIDDAKVRDAPDISHLPVYNLIKKYLGEGVRVAYQFS